MVARNVRACVFATAGAAIVRLDCPGIESGEINSMPDRLGVCDETYVRENLAIP